MQKPTTCLLTHWFHENFPNLDISTLAAGLDTSDNPFGAPIINIIIFNLLNSESVGVVLFENGKIGIEEDYWIHKGSYASQNYPFKYVLTLADPNCFRNLKAIIESYLV